MFFEWSTLLQLVALLGLLYYYIHKKYSYWSNRGIKGPTPIFPFGYHLVRGLSRPDDLEKRWQKEYGKVYGLYTGITPTLTVCDPELIKQILVKDFPKFVNRRELNTFHPIFNLNLFFAEDSNWKRIRTITSPAFSSGKLRGMYPLMGKCIDRLVEHFGKVAKNGTGSEFNTKEVMAGFTIDVIASAAFATEVNANEELRNRESPFIYHALQMFKFNPFKILAGITLPKSVNTFLGVRFLFSENSFKFMEDIARNILENREKAKSGKKLKTVRHDLMQLLMDSFVYEEDLDRNANNYDGLIATESMTEVENVAKENSAKTKQQLTKDEIVAQCFLFYVAGFETTATTLTHAMYELAQNPDVQQRLLDDIEEALDGADFSLENFDILLTKVPYLDAVVKETLRRYPPVIRLERRVGVDGVKLDGIPLDKGVLIEIPTVAVHHNPEYYPEPEKFNPDRFMPENKHLLVPYTYIPFGDGPRNCAGMRFAYQEAKLCIARLVTEFRFQPTTTTPDRLTIRRGNLFMNSLHFNLKVSAR